MKFTCQVDIRLPREKVIALFDNVDNLKHWQDGFISFENISGEPGQPGTKSRLKYKIGKREIELIETITVRDLPNEFSGTYDTETMSNSMVNKFVELDDHSTRYTSEIEYTRFTGFIPKLMAWLMPGLFKKQTQKWLDQFRDFAEKAE